MATSTQQKQYSGNSAIRGLRIAYVFFSWLFLAGIFVQVFLAGASVFAGPSWWSVHVAFGHGLGTLTFILLILAFVGRYPWQHIGLTALLPLLYVLQYMLVTVPGSIGLIILSAFHPVNAIVLFWVTLTLARRAWKFI